MGRHVYEAVSGQWVWKYIFAQQASEQHRLYHTYGIGRLYLAADDSGDLLELTQDDVPALEALLEEADAAARIERFEDYQKQFVDERGHILLEDIDKVKQWQVDHGETDIHFYRMVKRYLSFIKARPDQARFLFQGQY